jgi:hypothetical protein
MTREAANKTLFDHPSDMEPLLPAEGDGRSPSRAVLSRLRPPIIAGHGYIRSWMAMALCVTTTPCA